MNAQTQRPGSERLTAVLGPTNTGKTYMAMERLLGHRSGMIGFPLRLLARENYDRAVKALGAEACALVTGEEKIVPRGARYFFCTVESMPLDRPVAFVAVDEIQLAADSERGHIFTDRLMRARGLDETMFMGSDAATPWVKLLVPGIEIVNRPRFSTLTYAGSKKITRLPPRSAVVAFSAADVYAIADLIRRQRGGTAIVMGALSPRTRNAQVDLYQAGEVDYLVATDAIGMGLNLNVGHVAFAALRKFDGRSMRSLSRAEIGQIAGRAGRHMTDGTFGTTAEVGPMDPDLIEAVENHRVDPIHFLMWRNAELDFRSVDGLLRSLDARSPHPGLVRQQEAIDHQSLAALARDEEIRVLAHSKARVTLLWEVCQVPDFRKLMTDAHLRLLSQIFRHLAGGRGLAIGRIPTDWIADQMSRLDRIDGDIDHLTQRIAHIRTWSYVAQRSEWLSDAPHWQGRAQEIEDRLSDALHEALTQRFVDRRHAALHRRMVDGGKLEGAVAEDGAVTVEGHEVGQLKGLDFLPAIDANLEEARPLLAAARRVLGPSIRTRVAELVASPDGAFHLSADGAITWRETQLARLTRGDQPLRPMIELKSIDLIDGRQRQAIEQRLRHWLDRLLRHRLRPIYMAQSAKLEPAARGLVYQLSEGLGALHRESVRAQLNALSATDRKALAALGVRIGAVSIWMSRLDDRRQRRLLGLLAALWHRLKIDGEGKPDPLLLDASGLDAWQMAGGKRVVAGRGFAFGELERLALGLREAAAAKTLSADEANAVKFNMTPEELGQAMRHLNIRATLPGGVRVVARPKRGKTSAGKTSGATPKPLRPEPTLDPHSPFAGLSVLQERLLARTAAPMQPLAQPRSKRRRRKRTPAKGPENPGTP
ncbi:helicase-related protein [Dongia mobilis]|uniref:helicase-related protein n=1 Tax=Dongia sp. TaxID=1977262 RepID=UPI0026F11382